ncbi:cbb3-type cytochrome oxidase assembly protein CcoS [Moraxella bovis]|nr:cbb3-type cytochrome oxidase assembly protein CcoS [Moraxella bovis]
MDLHLSTFNTFYKRDDMVSIYLLIPLSLMLFVVAIWAIVYAVKSNQFEDLDNAPDQIILDDRQARRDTLNHARQANQNNQHHKDNA